MLSGVVWKMEDVIVWVAKWIGLAMGLVLRVCGFVGRGGRRGLWFYVGSATRDKNVFTACAMALRWYIQILVT